MKYLKRLTATIITILVFLFFLIPSLAYAWPEPKYYGKVMLISPVDGSWQGGNFQGQHWPEYVSNTTISNLGAPPELNNMQAYRWFQAMPSARPRLAQLYGVSDNVAKQYGAFYLDMQSNTQYGYPATYPSRKE